jgi:tetratricopeptide (TPR) repeat protein
VNNQTAGQPYPGTRSFLRSDAGRFFGRSADAAVVTEWWRNNRLTYLVGPAGRGKTSLLNAGMLPLLAGERADVLPVGSLSRGAAFPAVGLPTHNPYTLALLRSWDQDEMGLRLAGRGLPEFVRQLSSDGVLFAAIDAADELIPESNSFRKTDRRNFLVELRQALDAQPQLHLLIVGRQEATKVIADVLGHGVKYELKALSHPGAIDAITRPLYRIGRSFTEDAAAELLRELQTSRIVSLDGQGQYIPDDRVEPALLQIACAWLWNALPSQIQRVDISEVRRYGDVDAALAERCGQVITQVADDHNLSPKKLASDLIAGFVTRLGARAEVEEGPADTAEIPNAAARALVDEHLLISWVRSSWRHYELMHDRLIDPLRRATVTPPPELTAEQRLGAAERALTIGEPNLADRHARAALRIGKGIVRARAKSLLGNLAYDSGKLKDAETLYRESAQEYAAAGDGKAVAYQLAAIARTQLARGKAAEAVDQLHAAVVRQPNEPVLQTELADALWQDGQGTAAVAVLNDVLQMDGSDLAALRARGEILAYLGEAHRAIRDLDRVSPQGQPSIRAARGLALAELGDRLAARREIDDAVAEGQRNGPVLLYAARASALSGDDIAAHEFAQQAADATDPPLPSRYREVARQLADSG